jgi:hypothetical protein
MRSGSVPSSWLVFGWNAETQLALLAEIDRRGIAHGDLDAVKAVFAELKPPRQRKTPPKSKPGSIARRFARLRADGLTFADCVKAWAADDDDKYVVYAREHLAREGAVEFDDHVVLSDSSGGNYVMAWIWVDDDDIEVKS